MMKQYTVTGMSCAACSARIEKAVCHVEGVTACSVSLLTHSMGVEGSASEAAIVAAVRAAGYGASPKGTEPRRAEAGRPSDGEMPRLMCRLVSSLMFLAALMYVSMGHTMWGWPLPPFFDGNPVATALVQLLLTAAVTVINGRFFINGFRGLLYRAPNMDTLVALGASAAFGYSVYVLFAMTEAQAKGDVAAALHMLHGLYFESAAMILTLITVGKLLEARAKGRTTDALRGLMQLAPQTATVLCDGQEKRVPIQEVGKDDIVLVRPGETVPVDGIVLEGESAVNEAALTGESVPVDKQPGSRVSAATLNQSGALCVRATHVGEDTALAAIIRTVSDAAASKAPIAKIADRVSGIFVPCVMAVAAVTVISWLIAGATGGFALARGISVLVISCPCALGLATPVAIMVGSGKGARHGILFKTAESLETAGKVDIVVLDKTGTVTTGQPQITDLLPSANVSEQELLTWAASLERHSEHPLAKAVLAEAQRRGITPTEASDFRALAGSGVTAVIEGRLMYGGSMSFIGEKVPLPDQVRQQGELLASQGKTPLLFCREGVLLGMIAVADTVKEDSAQAIGQLKHMGMRVVMLTGDHRRTAAAVAERCGIDEVVAEVLPEGKESVIRRLQGEGCVAMVGDGINDAPALTRADVGVAVGAGTDIAIDAADVVLMRSMLSDVPAALRLSCRTLRIIRQNLFWAFIYNAMGIPLAAGAFVHLLGWELNPMFGAAAMSLSSFFVVSNALRLNLLNIDAPRHDRCRRKQKRKETSKTMQKTMKIEGMMCGNCEARVKKTLEALPAVESAAVSHEAGTALVTLKAHLADEVLKAAVEAQDYSVTDISEIN